MRDKKVWVKVFANPNPDEMEGLCRKGIYYNGRGYYRCEDAAAADAALNHFRARGLEAERSKGPGTPKFTASEAFMVGLSVERSARFSLF